VLGINATHITNRTVSDPTLPHACSVTTQTDGSAVVTFNTVDNGANCSTASVRSGQVTSAVGVTFGLELATDPDSKATFQRQPKGDWCSLNKVGVLKTYVAKSPSVADSTAALAACEAFCATSASCTVCSVDEIDQTTGLCQWSALPACGTVNHFAGSIVGDVSYKTLGGVATITMSGPADVWFGVGIDAKLMSDAPYTLLVNSSMVWEQKIGTCGSEAEHCPGSTLAKSITVVANSVSDGVRTVKMTRPFAGATPQHYTFGNAKVGGGLCTEPSPNGGRTHTPQRTRKQAWSCGAARSCPAPPGEPSAPPHQAHTLRALHCVCNAEAPPGTLSHSNCHC